MTETATAAAYEPSGLEETETRIAVRPEWTPESFRAQVEQEKQMRSIMAEYVKSAMIKDHHYYAFKDGDKPAITQEGAHSICSLLKCTIGPPEITKEFSGDHLTVSARVHIFNQDGVLVATGDGICSTREPKYAYRWAWENEVPDGVDVSGLKSKSGTGRNNKPWKQYQIPNQDLPELWNTILKMGVKRAKVAAVRQLPLVSELFVAEPESDDHEPPPKATAQARKPQPAPAAKPEDGGRAEAIEELRDLCKQLNAAGDSIKWTPVKLDEYVNDLFSVEDGLKSLGGESFQTVIEDLKGRLADLQKQDEAA